MMCAIPLTHHAMLFGPSHSALDELLDLPSALEVQPSTHELVWDENTDEEHLDAAGTGVDPDSSAHVPAALWLPAPDFDRISEQRPKLSAALRQRAGPASTSGVVWVGEAGGAGACCAATVGTEDGRAGSAKAPLAVSAAPGRKSRGACRPCYQTVLKVSFAGQPIDAAGHGTLSGADIAPQAGTLHAHKVVHVAE